jgi:hypothetical protein
MCADVRTSALYVYQSLLNYVACVVISIDLNIDKIKPYT